MPSGEERSQGGGSDLEELPELKLMVASFLQGSLETLDEEGKKTPLNPMLQPLAGGSHGDQRDVRPQIGGRNC